jgi:hypothetical protein
MLTLLYQALLLVRWNDYHCLQLITADILISTSRFIHSGKNYEATREYLIPSSILHKAGQSICSAVPTILETMPIKEINQSRDRVKSPIGGFLVLWSLCCVFKSPKIAPVQKNWVRNTLWSIGIHGFIPHASALVSYAYIKFRVE